VPQFCDCFGCEAREEKKSSSFLVPEEIDGKSASQPEVVVVGLVMEAKGSEEDNI
jgi:hypothetical protein